MVCSCSSSVREAQQVVAQADSLRVNHSVTYDDSLAMADAYAVLGKWRLFYPDGYAQACYYYGRLLRNRGDQVAAMQAFISGTHAPYVQRFVPLLWFSDYHILGRIYSNLGTMCHLDDEFQLSYDMYKLSAECFMKDLDTLTFHYVELSKAFELIELHNTDSALQKLDDIEQISQNDYVISLVSLIRAYAYHEKAQFDTAIFYANMVAPAYRDPSFLVVKAQCYASLEKYDSALYFAKQVMEHPNAPIQNKYNVAYIITHADSTLSGITKDSIIDYRSDLGVLRREEKSALSHAVEILQLDIQQMPSRAKITTIFFISILLLILVILSIWYMQGWLYKIRDEMSMRQEVLQEYQTRQSKRLQELETKCKFLHDSNDLVNQLHWKNYNDMCEHVNRIFDNFAEFILQNFNLNETEMRLCVLVVIDLSQKQIAKILPCAESSVKSIKKRTAKKLHTNGKDMRKFLLNYIVGDLT